MMLRKRHLCHIAPFLVMFIMACTRSELPKAHAPDCDLSAGPCIQELEGLTVTFEIFPRPVLPMQDVSIGVLLERNSVPVDNAEVTSDFTMPGMYMGKNFYTLTPVGKGIYRSEGVLPRCPKGEKLWRCEVTVVSDDSEPQRASFLFEVE